jgi:urate oxidase
MDTVQEYTVKTRLYAPKYETVFTKEENKDLVATDTQKNTVYLVAKRSSATSPEAFGVDLCRHFLKEYPMLSAVEVEVEEDQWMRHQTAEGWHEHGFLRMSPEKASARVRLTRADRNKPSVVSGISGLTVLKTTQSGFEDYLQDKCATALNSRASLERSNEALKRTMPRHGAS